MSTFWCEHAWLPDGVTSGVLVRTADGTITEVTTAERPPLGARRLRGVVLPGFANAHSHAFHRALRGRTHGDGGTFWTWREGMYTLAAKLTPDNYLRLARAVYAEMALAGVTSVGEFHYVHHAPGGKPYAEANVMGEALREAAAEAGVRLTLLDTCYLSSGFGSPLTPEQLRFGDGDAAGWAARVDGLAEDANTRVGAAVHSVRAVPRDQIPDVVSAAAGRPLHVHLSEQPAENEACRQAHGLTPTELLHEAGALSERTTAVHATHLTPGDIALLGGARTGACFCPTTEADLADGIGPARELHEAGSPLSLGSDQHAVADPLLEARALEHNERLRTGQRGRFSPEELLRASTVDGHRALGWPDAGVIAPGYTADLVAIRLDTVRTAGSRPQQVLLSATASDVDAVVSGGRLIVQGGEHLRLGAVGPLLAKAIHEVWA
ncbi:formiminoglutamate deiminase [Crossiella equi]|uniref:Formiminoglutamate deiminase n=1 Tax=Crossiella equi TaxID=130796 RepID=A0ABS5AD61_9PSEU|nr:formimidoylglutamate deiminase [Crossiella equi]MBP2474513.1 formiminoglutamate deiminase [Crossiella equi]